MKRKDITYIDVMKQSSSENSTQMIENIIGFLKVDTPIIIHTNDETLEITERKILKNNIIEFVTNQGVFNSSEIIDFIYEFIEDKFVTIDVNDENYHPICDSITSWGNKMLYSASLIKYDVELDKYMILFPTTDNNPSELIYYSQTGTLISADKKNITINGYKQIIIDENNNVDEIIETEIEFSDILEAN